MYDYNIQLLFGVCTCTSSVHDSHACFLYIAMMMPGAMPQPTMPTTSPAINPQQLAEQQQAFINQQALLMVRKHS